MPLTPGLLLDYKIKAGSFNVKLPLSSESYAGMIFSSIDADGAGVGMPAYREGDTADKCLPCAAFTGGDTQRIHIISELRNNFDMTLYLS